MQNCPFCAIIAKQLPAYIVYEDNDVLAILPKEMEAFGHTLITPKKHYESIFDVAEQDLRKVISGIQCLSLQYQRTIGATGVNILHASGKDAQQSIPHLHFHLIPRFPNDQVNARPSFIQYTGDKTEVLKKLQGR
ncbi:MAG: HIT domain-containing protein [Candidatus Peribacteria bacterium]|jgi:histidine triad (HIT) family protein|nr:HIT domain-containing protein [Candidatus Peribacteria bacterium]